MMALLRAQSTRKYGRMDELYVRPPNEYRFTFTQLFWAQQLNVCVHSFVLLPCLPNNEHNKKNGAGDESLDPGSTVTLFCRRDFRRYLRWKRRELASQDNERRKEEQTRYSILEFGERRTRRFWSLANEVVPRMRCRAHTYRLRVFVLLFFAAALGETNGPGLRPAQFLLDDDYFFRGSGS